MLCFGMLLFNCFSDFVANFWHIFGPSGGWNRILLDKQCNLDRCSAPYVNSWPWSYFCDPTSAMLSQLFRRSVKFRTSWISMRLRPFPPISDVVDHLRDKWKKKRRIQDLRPHHHNLLNHHNPPIHYNLNNMLSTPLQLLPRRRPKHLPALDLR